MPSAATPLPTVALFGGTAGTGLSFLTQFLAASSSTTINVLARTPSRLHSFTNQPNLHIIAGDIRSIPSLKSCLVHGNRLVDIVVSSIGMTMQRKGLSITSPDPTICEDGTAAILKALGELESDPNILRPESGKRARIVVLSTTGISDKGRDVPCLMMPIYRKLHVPHEDKKNMEALVIASGREWVAVRPSFLMDGERLGRGSLRVSVEGGESEKAWEGDVAVGYTISRADVAGWILEECVMGGEDAFAKWKGKMVTITY